MMSSNDKILHIHVGHMPRNFFELYLGCPVCFSVAQAETPHVTPLWVKHLGSCPNDNISE